jgi:hypothetical protein
MIAAARLNREFRRTIPLPKSKPLVTLRDAANYIVKLPEAEQQAPEWQAAAEVLMMIGEHGGEPTTCSTQSTD